MKIYVATITHKHGANFYAARSREALDKQIADYCREYWSTWFDDSPQDLDNAETIEGYFDCHAHESVEIGEAELTGQSR